MLRDIELDIAGLDDDSDDFQPDVVARRAGPSKTPAAPKPSAAQSKLFAALPGRRRQTEQLQQLLFTPGTRLPPSLFITGLPATGKTAVLRHLSSAASASTTSVRTIWISCLETFTQRLLFEAVLNQAAGVAPDAGNGYRVHARCEYPDEFVDSLREICGGRGRGQGDQGSASWVLVLDKVDALRSIKSATLLPMFLKLAELTRLNLCVVLVSSLCWDDLCGRGSYIEPIMMAFPPYTKEETLSVIALDCAKDEPLPFFMSFVEMLYGVFHTPCRDLNELRHIVALLYPKYTEPVREGKVGREQTSKLFGYVQKYIKEALHSLYLRDISSSEWERQIKPKSIAAAPQSTPASPFASSAHTSSAPPPSQNTRTYDLPYYTKFLLIASFLASYNPPRLDARFFSKSGNSRARDGVSKKGAVHNGGKMRQQLLGPKAFAVERMLAIFYSIVDDPNDVDAGFHLYSQIATLVSLRLLVRVTALDNLEAAKCKCNASYDLVSSIGRTVRFDLSKYLFDFVLV